MNLELRECTEKDFEFAFDAKKQAIGPHIKSKWGWDEEYQLSVHKERWREKPWFVIHYDNNVIGTVSIHHINENTSRFGEFYIIDEFRNKGLGSKVLNQFLKECDKNKQIVILEYLKWNPVGTLYKRFGFKVVSENDIHYFMERNPHSH